MNILKLMFVFQVIYSFSAPDSRLTKNNHIPVSWNLFLEASAPANHIPIETSTVAQATQVLPSTPPESCNLEFHHAGKDRPASNHARGTAEHRAAHGKAHLRRVI